MSKFTVNHVTVVEKGANGPWAYALVSAQDVTMADGSRPDVIELRGLGLETFQRIARALPSLRNEGLTLTCDAETRCEERIESFQTKAGEPATKKVVRLYLQSTPVWNKEEKPVVSEGNLGDILGDGSEEPF